MNGRGDTLPRCGAARDYYAGVHPERVARIAVVLAARLGYEGPELDAIEVGALLHDIGKAGIPEAILLKPGPLDEGEWQVMRAHPVISDSILSGVRFHPFVREIARSTHERLDGNGYPDGLADPAISLPARIVAVADAFDALTTDRAYRPARSVAFALAELRAHAGTQFCPRVVAALEHVYREDARALVRARVAAATVA
jgi:HD-GYP domain-containing protein (c-di-GMP phosphodiesterase class II)